MPKLQGKQKRAHAEKGKRREGRHEEEEAGNRLRDQLDSIGARAVIVDDLGLSLDRLLKSLASRALLAIGRVLGGGRGLAGLGSGLLAGGPRLGDTLHLLLGSGTVVLAVILRVVVDVGGGGLESAALLALTAG